MLEVFMLHHAQRKGSPSAFFLKRLEKKQKEWPMCQDSIEEKYLNCWQPSQRFGVIFKLVA